MRAEIKNNNLSIITQIKEIKKKMDEKLATPAPPSEPKPANKQLHQIKISTIQENYDGIRFGGIPELKTNNSRENYEHDLEQVKEITKSQ